MEAVKTPILEGITLEEQEQMRVCFGVREERFRADKLIEDFMAEKGVEPETPIDGWSQEQMKKYIDDNQIPCPSCGKHDFTDIRQFNLMFKTFQGVTEDAKNTVYLRPETAQGILSPSVTRSHRVTSHSVPESSSRWS